MKDGYSRFAKIVNEFDILDFTGDKMVWIGVRYLVKMMSISEQFLAEA